MRVGDKTIRLKEIPKGVLDFTGKSTEQIVEAGREQLKTLMRNSGIRSITGQRIFFKPKAGTDFDYYFNHLTRGDKKANGTAEAEINRQLSGSLVEEDGVWGPVQVARVRALRHAEDTIKQPNLGINQVDRGTKLLVAAYSAPEIAGGKGNIGSYIVIGIDVNGDVVAVTSFSTEDGKKKTNPKIHFQTRGKVSRVC